MPLDRPMRRLSGGAMMGWQEIPMRIVRDDLQLCDDCTIAAVNGDFTGLDYHYGDQADKRESEIEAGLLRLGIHLVPDFNSETNRGINEFSSRRCDCCTSRLAGSRHQFAILG